MRSFTSSRGASFFPLAIYFTQDKVQAAQNGNHVTDAIPTHHFWQNLQVHQGWATQLGTPGILAAVADEVDAHFPPAALEGEVGFAARGTQCHRRARADGPTGHVINRD